MPQQAVLFTGTIRDNMQWAAPGASDEEIWQALEIAQAAEFVRGKPGMLDAPVETAGRNFSGGQRQRLTIARALVPKPKILILDDSASALDFATDAALRKAIKEETHGMTVFIVSQRAASVQRADHILVLDDGKLVGDAPHAELLRSCEVMEVVSEGGGLPVAFDASIRFSHLGKRCVSSAVHEKNLAFAQTLTPKDILIVLSASGQSARLEEVSAVAKGRDVPVLVITCDSHGPLAQLADYVMTASNREQRLIEGSHAASLLSPNVLIEVLYYLLRMENL